MIARALHSVNAGLALSPAPVGTVEGVNLADTVERIVEWGGDADLYRHFLTAGLAADDVTTATARALGVVAGWRSGVVDLRDEALLRVVDLAERAVTAVLGLKAGQVGAFLTNQQTDPFAWPTTDKSVARIGGFSGFGGTWVAAPTQAEFIAINLVSVHCGAEQWLAYVDVFGARIVRSETTPAKGPAAAKALVSENSYLVEIVRAA